MGTPAKCRYSECPQLHLLWTFFFYCIPLHHKTEVVMSYQGIRWSNGYIWFEFQHLDWFAGCKIYNPRQGGWRHWWVRCSVWGRPGGEAAGRGVALFCGPNLSVVWTNQHDPCLSLRGNQLMYEVQEMCLILLHVSSCVVSPVLHSDLRNRIVNTL